MESYVSLSGEDEANTILDAKYAADHFIYCLSDNNLTIEDLTIQGGHANSGSARNNSGGGIFCDDSSPTLINCTISGNTADYYAGGIYCGGGRHPTILNSILWGDDPDEIAGYTTDVTVT